MIKFENVSKVYSNGFKALQCINLHIKKGEIMALIGPSGCGKTTTMKMINKLNDFTSGNIYIQNEKIQNLDPINLRRKMGYVIQSVGLFPHMTIEENLSLIPKLKNQEYSPYHNRVCELLSLVGLDPKIYLSRYPKELSGGQQQRIGVIRALAFDPEIILMDEPFSALDPITREQLQDELLSLQENLKKTIIFVTHDMSEALKIADRICIMKEGSIIQLDTPEQILRHPKNDFVKNFIGSHSSYSNEISAKDLISKAICSFSTKKIAESIKWMQQNKVDNLIVTDDKNKFLGIVSAKDLYKNYKNENLCLKDIIDTNVITANLDDDLSILLQKSKKNSKSFLPILNQSSHVKGVITYSSIVEFFAEEIN